MKPLGLSTPHLIIMVGIPGSGKSFFAEHFAETFTAPYVSHQKIADQLFENYDNNQEQQAIIASVSDYILEQLMVTNQTIVYEGMTNNRTDRQLLVNEARAHGYEPLFVWVQTESLTAKARATKPQQNRSPITASQFDMIVQQFVSPNATEKAIVISGKHTYASQLRIVLKHLASSHVATQPNHSISERRRIAIR